MSIGIYAFLRIYFLRFGLSAFAQFRTHSAPPSTPPPSRSARRGRSGIECRPVQRVLHGLRLHLVRPALRSPARCAGEGRSAPAGYTAAAQPRPVSPVTTEKIKKTHLILTNQTPSDCASPKNFPQKQKDPYKGSVFCAILALQALKGRNL